MRSIEIDISDIRSKEALHERIREKLDFPDYYGGNLDALYDCLTDISEPMEVAFVGKRACIENAPELEGYFEKLEMVLADASSEDENLIFLIIEDEEVDDEIIVRSSEGMENMSFRGLDAQYEALKEDIDAAVRNVLESGVFIGGEEVAALEAELAEYVGTKHCISCASGTDALEIALTTLGVGPGDAVFVPDFTFVAPAEAVARCGATPIFIDVAPDTFGMEPRLLSVAIDKVRAEESLTPKAVIAVDLFGLPAKLTLIKEICEENGLFLVEDGAQGFGGTIREKKACSFGDISITSFFPAKPLGCYGDGGALFTDNDEWAEEIRSICNHGRGSEKYDHVRVGMNSRLDAVQAAILRVKLRAFVENELAQVNKVAEAYRMAFKIRFGEGSTRIWLPKVPEGYLSSYAQFTVRFANKEDRDGAKAYLEERGIPTRVYYQKPLHAQEAFGLEEGYEIDSMVTNKLCNTVLSLPIGPYMDAKSITAVVGGLWEYFGKPEPEENLNPFANIAAGYPEAEIR